ncbi:MAG: MFS transporter, partial [Jatrophihabitantaceae bacterium]
AGWLTDLAGVRAAYLLGLALTVAALLVGWLLVPASPSGRAARLDLTGASWLAAGLLLLLLMISQNQWWRDRPVVATGGLIVALLLLAGWAARQWRQPEPLLDLRLLRQPTMLGANASMLLGGVGMYLLVTLITRFVQSPDQAGYGFGFSTFQAGLVLVPFSALGFLAGRLTPRLNQRVNPIASLAVSSIVVLLAFVLFATARSSWYLPVLAMAVLGYGVGSFSAAMPAVILPVTAAAETSAAMAANQVVRSVGFSIGSAVGGLILAANTGAGRRFPAEHGYVVAAWLGAVIMLATAALVAVTGRGGAARTDGQCLAPATNRGQH